MFFLEVKCGDQDIPHTNYDFEGELQTLKYDDIVISYLSGRLNAVYSHMHKWFLMGEPRGKKSVKYIIKYKGESANNQDIFKKLDEYYCNLVLVDLANKRIILRQETSGIWPLYFLTEKNRYLFSSHIDAIRKAYPELKPDDDRYAEFCVYRYILRPNSLYKGIRKPVKRQVLTIDMQTGAIEPTLKWKKKKAVSPGETDYHLDMIRYSLFHSMKRGFSKSKKTGILLSGGIDSALLAAICKKGVFEFGSFSSSFAFINKDDHEDEYALSVARHLDLNHTIISSTPEQYLTDLVWSIHAAEEPVHHLQSVMLYRLFREAVESGYNVFLCGEGADSLFGNDAHVKYYKNRARIRFARFTAFKAAYRALNLKNERLNYFAHDFGKGLDTDNHILWTLGRYGDPEIIGKYFQCSLKEICKPRMSLMNNFPELGMMDRITALSLFGEGCQTMTVWSKLAENNGIRIVYPYDSPDVIGPALEIPWSIKMREEKYVIRSLLRKYEIPEEFVTRPKLSFGFPVKFWAPHGALFQPIVDMAGEMFEPGFLKGLQCEEISKAMILWNMINLYLWHKMFIDNIGPEDLCGEILDRRRSYQK